MASILLSADLIFVSKLDAAAARGGTTIRTASSLKSLIEAATDQAATMVIVDLSLPGLDVGAAIERIRGLPHPPQTVIAFGPHVHTAKLAEAEKAGFDAVLSRGQFNAEMDDWLRGGPA